MRHEVTAMMGGWGNGWWMLMWLWMAAFWLLVIGGAVWAATSLGKNSHRPATSALDVLDGRLATGEITVAEYRRLKDELGGANTRYRGGSSHLLIGGIIALAAALLLAGPVFAVTNSDWNMWDHMGGMMGGGHNTSNAALTSGGSAETVTMSDLAFSPGNLRVPVGATVTWTNRDSAPHNATARDGAWNTQTLSPGQSGSVTFDQAGEYDYYCTVHPSMKGHLSVQ